MRGTTYAAVKQAIVTALAADSGFDQVEVSPQPPVEPGKVRNLSGQSVWITDAEGTQDNVVFCGPGRLDIDETYDLTVVFQALPDNTDDTQIVTDERVDDMLGAFLAVMAADPTWGLTETADLPIQHLYTTRGSWERFIGPLADRNIRPSRCHLHLTVEARLSFT